MCQHLDIRRVQREGFASDRFWPKPSVSPWLTTQSRNVPTRPRRHLHPDLPLIHTPLRHLQLIRTIDTYLLLDYENSISTAPYCPLTVSSDPRSLSPTLPVVLPLCIACCNPIPLSYHSCLFPRCPSVGYFPCPPTIPMSAARPCSGMSRKTSVTLSR